MMTMMTIHSPCLTPRQQRATQHRIWGVNAHRMDEWGGHELSPLRSSMDWIQLRTSSALLALSFRNTQHTIKHFLIIFHIFIAQNFVQDNFYTRIKVEKNISRTKTLGPKLTFGHKIERERQKPNVKLLWEKISSCGCNERSVGLCCLPVVTSAEGRKLTSISGERGRAFWVRKKNWIFFHIFFSLLWCYIN